MAKVSMGGAYEGYLAKAVVRRWQLQGVERRAVSRAWRDVSTNVRVLDHGCIACSIACSISIAAQCSNAMQT